MNGDHNISQDQVKALLTITSIARHSTYYWGQEAGFGYGGPSKNLPTVVAIAAGAADAIGGVGGWLGSDDDAGFFEKAKNAIIGAGSATGAFAAAYNFFSG